MVLYGIKWPEQLQKILHDHLPELERKYNVSYLGIFGSYIREEETKGSDLDILVEFSKKLGLMKITGLENYLSDLLGVKVDIVPKRSLKPCIGENILEEVESVQIH
ncbi:DNA polymerase beta domain protein region [Methanohalobium evestigatum Z-7303]|uniref:protein adenylyltransferase n=1 Tax=Methanohalobium evestigatum (strain ATCC BAA-1072 / DSM 3721 / NBRC 107634 / OCM 161 / Z-7303) TaxID=644295 RepID=D7E7K4_METEZ|nr:nucleotidyltransferase [Methanohalobium evestigatum]ADI74077.1 DNA polymerase beta domain protein region [Methanohalobium evestigatum Z-7303]